MCAIKTEGTYWREGYFERNCHNRVHPEARRPKPGSPFHASRRASSYWPTLAQTRLWPDLKRVHQIPATHLPIGYLIFNHTYPIMSGLFGQQPTHARVIASSRDVAGQVCGRRCRALGRTLILLCSLYVMHLSLTRDTKSHLSALGTTQISSYFTKH